jgi:CheY-like chemotaxis protein
MVNAAGIQTPQISSIPMSHVRQVWDNRPLDCRCPHAPSRSQWRITSVLATLSIGDSTLGGEGQPTPRQFRFTQKAGAMEEMSTLKTTLAGSFAPWTSYFFQSFDLPHESCEEAAVRRNKLRAEELKPLILVADDEPLIRSTLVQILKLAGYDAVTAEGGNEAVDCAKNLLPDVFLADVSMPTLNGVEAAKFVRSISPATRIICFSGHAAASDLLDRAREQGYDFEFISKPIRPDALIKVLGKL